MMPDLKLKMGVRVKCRVTGLVGIITGKTEYINGCIQWLVSPPVDKEGKVVDGRWIDTIQLEIVDAGISVVEPEIRPGGPRSDAPPTSYQH
jgi:hypothetical protein